MNIKIEKLIKQFAKLPRVGTRAATRIVIGLLQDKTGRAESLANALLDAAKSIRPCSVCGVLTDGEVCEYCADTTRKNGQLCIVRDLSDVLGAMLSGVNGITPQDLNIANLSKRIQDENIEEIIFALPNTVEGKTTQQYIISSIGNMGVSFSELASGVPLGGDLDYIDDGTLTLAFGGRKKL